MRRAETRSRAGPKAAVAALFWCFSLCFFSFCGCLEIITSRMDPHTKDLGRVGILGGPGSYPPRCVRKCGRCIPCHPVHVTVPPGTSVTNEYYPEAWRCKCGNRLYIP